MKCLSVLILSCFCASLIAAELEFSDPYVQANVPGSSNTVGYVKLTNASDDGVKIVGAEAAIAKNTELHVHSMMNDCMSMRRVDVIDVPAKSTVELAPSGYHLMFINLNGRVKAGTVVDVTVLYDDGSKQTVPFSVIDPRKQKQAKAANHSHHAH